MSAVRAGGLRLSSARRLVLEALFAAHEPVAAERIASGLDGHLPPSDLASVYRNLGVLEEAGLVCELRLGRAPGRYAPAAGAPREYAACERCGAMTEVDPKALDGVRAAVRAALGYEARFGHFPLVGLCPGCAGAQSDVRAG